MLTNSFIIYLIGCEKVIRGIPRKEMTLDRCNWRNDIKMSSKDDQYEFSVYMRKNDFFEENFSIGLKYHPKDVPESITLLRCNGPHGPHKLFNHHEKFHIHLATEKSIASGAKPERDAQITKEYSSYNEALIYFIKKCNIQGAEKAFLSAKQLSLF